MKILFDFEYFGNPSMDTNLLEIMLTIKSELIKNLAPYEIEMNEDKGFVIVTIKPTMLAFQYSYAKNKAVFEKVQPILKAFDWESAIKKFTQTDLN